MIVVWWRFDRLGRSLLNVRTPSTGSGQGIVVRSIADVIDPNATTSRLMLNMLSTLPECERELIGERVNVSIAVAIGAGGVFGRPPNDPVVTARKVMIAASVPHRRQNGTASRRTRRMAPS